MRAVVRQVARDNGEDPEAAVAKVCLESEVMRNLDIIQLVFVFPYSLLGWKPLLFTLLTDGTGFLRWERDWSPSWREGASRAASGMECEVQGADKRLEKGHA